MSPTGSCIWILDLQSVVVFGEQLWVTVATQDITQYNQKLHMQISDDIYEF